MLSLLKYSQPKPKQHSKVQIAKACLKDQVEQKSEGEGSFYYNDHLTNEHMVINKNKVLVYPTRAVRHSHRDETEKQEYVQVDNKKIMKQCYQLLKSTRKFHLSSLQAKHYKITKNQHNREGKINSDDQLKILEQSKVDKCLKRKREERKDYSKQKQKLSHLLNLKQIDSHTVPCQSIHTTPSSPRCSIGGSLGLTSQNSGKIRSISRLQIQERFGKKQHMKQLKKKQIKQKQNRVQIKEENESNHNNNCFLKKLVRVGGGDKSMKNIPFSIGKSIRIIQDCTPQQKFVQQTQNELRSMLRKKQEYLVMPKVANRVATNNKNNNYNEQQTTNSLTYKRSEQRKSNPHPHININKDRKKAENQKKRNNKYFRKSQLDPFLFKLDSNMLKISTNRSMKPQPVVSEQMCQIFNKVVLGIQESNYYGVQIQLSLNPAVLHLKQQSNQNNLLHICVMSNREELFQMILRKCLDLKIGLAEQKNKYGRTPIQLGNMLGFFRKKELKQVIKKIQKDNVVKAYQFLAYLL